MSNDNYTLKPGPIVPQDVVDMMVNEYEGGCGESHLYSLLSELAHSHTALRIENEKLKILPTKDKLLGVIMSWKYGWMDVRGTDEKDRKNYYSRAFGVDANMQHGLARMLLDFLKEHQKGTV